MSTKRVKFTFPTNLVRRHIIHDLSQEFHVITNIRKADIRDDSGWVVLELEGDADQIDLGVDWVKSLGVRVDPIVGDIVEG